MIDDARKAPAASVSLALLGSGGAGIAAAGEVLLETARRAGLHGRLSRSFGPQIRGGETAAFLVLGTTEELAPTECFDLVFALDWNKAERFRAELPVGPDTCVVAADDAGEAPAGLPTPRYRLPLRTRARADGVRENLQMLSILTAWLDLPFDALLTACESRFRRSLGEAARATLAALRDTPRPPGLPVPPPGDPAGARWNVSGNEATGLGLLTGGVRLAAAYPITPATDLLEWLAPRLEGLGGQLVQAEDELAAINMVVGASFGGVPAMTATSGPGLSLMHEGIGLAISAELPLVVVNVQRGGPSTGLPTKSEQSDLTSVLFGPHGDAPQVVLAPTGVADCAPTAAWAVELAERLQVPVIIQSEQALAQTRVVCDAVALPAPAAGRLRPPPAAAGDPPYARYADTPSGVSPMSIPGDPGGRYVADGLEHFESGAPTTAAAAHAQQVAKRRRKLETHEFGTRWCEPFEAHAPPGFSRAPACVILCMGSLYLPACRAAERLAAAGLATRAVALRLLAPARPEALAALVAGAQRVIVVEQNDGAQLRRYLQGWWGLSSRAESLARVGPIPISAGEIVACVADAERLSA